MSSADQALAQGGDAAEAVIRDAVTDAGVLDVMANNLGLVAAFVAIMYVTAGICAVREVMNSRTSQAII